MTSDHNFLENKRILFISARFFGYEKLIKEELESKGAIVDYHDERPDNGFWTKALIRIDRRLIARKTNAYYQRIIDSTRSKSYDHVLIVRGEAISPEMLQRLRKAQPVALMTLYLWDSMHYNPNARNLLDLFDRVFSFDRTDVEKHPKMRFLPLFYGREFERSAQWQGTPVYDACFIGTIHTDRYKILEKILQTLEAKGRKVFVFCYYPSKLLFWLRSLINPRFRKFGKKHISFKSMTLLEVIDKFSKSTAIIDINRPNQLGLTMRSIEAVGAQRKLITTNSDILNYDIFNSETILIIDRNCNSIDEHFFKPNPLPYEEKTRKKYSITAWLNCIFSPSIFLESTKIDNHSK